MYGEESPGRVLFLDCAVEIVLVAKSGAWYSLDPERLGQGRENAKQYLRENPEIAAMIEEKFAPITTSPGAGDVTESGE